MGTKKNGKTNGTIHVDHAQKPGMRMSVNLEKFQAAFAKKFGAEFGGCDFDKYDDGSYAIKVGTNFPPNKLQELTSSFAGVDFEPGTYTMNRWVVAPNVLASFIPDLDVTSPAKVQEMLRQFPYMESAEVSEHGGNFVIGKTAAMPNQVFTTPEPEQQQALDQILAQFDARPAQKMIMISGDLMRTAVSQMKDTTTLAK